MRAIDIIRSKRDGEVLRREAIQAVVRGVTDGSWPDYQVTAFLMAVLLRGMTLEEATALTEAMVDSGQRLEWSDAVSPPAIGAVDKHSTGGVGDKTSLAVGPIVVIAWIRRRRRLADDWARLEAQEQAERDARLVFTALRA